MRKIAFYFLGLIVLFSVQLILSCKTSNVLPGHVPYEEFVDSAYKANITIPSKKEYTASGGVSYSDLRARMALGQALGRMFSEEKQEKQTKASIAYWLDHTLDMGMFSAEYMLTDNEKVKVFMRFYNGRSIDSVVFCVDSAFVEKNQKRIPVEVRSARFTMVKNPPLNFVFTCCFKYRREWYSFYYHVDIEKDASFTRHETLCELLR